MFVILLVMLILSIVLIVTLLVHNCNSSDTKKNEGQYFMCNLSAGKKSRLLKNVTDIFKNAKILPIV